jgi:two-component system response regulator AtoC
MSELRLLIIDDEENMRHMLKALVRRHGYDVTTAHDGASALSLVEREHFDFILCDVKMPGIDGMTFLEKGRQFIRDSTVIMMSAYGTVDLALQAMQSGAYDFISKPFKSDEVLLTLKKAEEREHLRRENRRLKQKIYEFSKESSFSGMVASSDKIRHLIEVAIQVAQYDTTVLITGESGTGKELIARGIHTNSPRNERTFVAINCASLPENLLESELFGHVRGAFTGAEHQNKGLFREADGSTIFLDEIGEMPLSMQVKLLRVLQEREIRPVGASRSEKVNVRVLAATSKDLAQQVNQGEFREDLYYRLNVVQLKVPPLRERKDDIPLLCHHFIKKYNKKFKTNIIDISKETIGLILSHEWPGNVRELENVIQRGLVLASGETIEVENLPHTLRDISEKDISDTWLGIAMESLSLKTAQKQLEDKFIRFALAESGGNKSQAARTLEISYPSLLSKIKEYGIETD